MLRRYAVELSQTAEASYTKLFDEAQECPDIGKKANQKVTLFRIIDRALDSLSMRPFDERRSLAGRLLSSVYVINLDSICVYYHVDLEQHIVFIRSIEIRTSHPDLSWVRKPEFRDQATMIFDALGIDGTDFLSDRPPFAVN